MSKQKVFNGINLFFAFILVAALAVAGCGGGGGGGGSNGTPPEMTGTTTDEILTQAKATVQEASDGIKDAYDEAVAAVAAIDGMEDADPASYALAMDRLANAKSAYDVAKAANEAAQAAETVEAVGTAAAPLDMAMTDVAEALAGVMQYAMRVSDAQTQIDEGNAEAAMKMALTKAANTKREAIDTLATAIDTLATAIEAGGETTLTTPTMPNGYTVKRKDGKVSMIDDPALYEDEGDPKFVMKNGMWMRDNGKGVSEIVSVSTAGMDAPVQRSFRSVYHANMIDGDGDQNDAPEALLLTGLAVDEMRPSGQAEILALLGDGTLPVTSSDVGGTGFPTGKDGTDSEYDNEEKVKGMFAGADGTYQCLTEEGCGAEVVSKRKAIQLTGDWRFTPSAGARATKTDPDYLEYGFWLKKTVKDGATTYNEVSTFARQMGYRSGDAGFTPETTLSGPATYAGGAAGVYVHDTIGAGGAVGSSTSGVFTADVSLTAYFGNKNDDALLKDQNMIKGTISDFVLSGGEANTWSVGLSAGLRVGGAESAFRPTVSGDTKATGADGNWVGKFHGSASPAGEFPAAVTGEFNANFINGAAAGAFGAEKK